MPVSRTVNGLVAEITLDVRPDAWLSCNFDGQQLTDTDTKKEGLASNKLYGTTPDPAVEGWGYTTLPNVAMDNGNLIRFWHKTTDAKHNWGILVWGSFPYGEDARRYTRGWLGYDDPVPRSDIHLGLITGRMNGVADWTLYEYVVDWMWEGEGYLCDYTPALLLLVEGGADVPGSPPMGQNWADWFDHIVVCTSHDLTFTGLLPGQKVEMYRSPSTLLYTQTCAGGATSVTSDLSADDFPMNGYFKVYATDGITLIETTAVVQFSGGDTWYWVSPYGTMKAETSAFVIVRTSGTGTPKSATITATLLKPDTTPAVGKTLYFTTSKGSVTPTSAVTDANGQAQTVLSSDSHGIAVVKINWPGDAVVPACMTWAVHHVLYNAEVGDTAKKYQFFVEGIELDYDTGHYSLSTETAPQEFEVTLPAWGALILRRSLVSIYRWGVKEYSGILTGIERDMGTEKPVILSGVDSKMLLETRIITLKDYSDQPLATVLDDILDTYPCGIILGTVGEYPSNINMTFSDENIVSSVSRMTGDVLGWLYRVNADNTLDVMGAFGSSKPNIVFEQGVSMFNAKYRINDSAMSNSVRARGKETLVSTLFDPASIEEVGIIEDVAFQKSIDVQGTLDLFAQTELAKLVAGTTEVSCDVIDSALTLDVIYASMAKRKGFKFLCVGDVQCGHEDETSIIYKVGKQFWNATMIREGNIWSQFSKIKPVSKLEDVKLHLGRPPMPGYVNYDVEAIAGVDYSMPIDKLKPRLPFEDETFASIVVENFAEHILDKIMLLRELWRVSEPNAKIRLVVRNDQTDPAQLSSWSNRTFDSLTDLFTVESQSSRKQELTWALRSLKREVR